MPTNTSGNQSGESKPLMNRLRDFLSLITHAKGIAEDTEAVVSSLRNHSVNANTFSLAPELTANINNIRRIFADSSDVRIRELIITQFQCKAAIVFIDGMVDHDMIAEHIVQRLTALPSGATNQNFDPSSIVDDIKNSLLTVPSMTEVTTMEQVISHVLNGSCALLIDGIGTVIMIATRKLDFRAIDEPKIESGLRGPQDSFTEEMAINITLLRRRIKNENLIVKHFKIGTRSQTDIAIVYYRGIVNPDVVYQVEQRLTKINVDNPASKTNIENLIKDHPLSPFPTIFATERPDRLTMGLMQGKVAILQDGTPFCLAVPTVITDFFKTTDDYYDTWVIGSFIRFIRYIMAVLALLTPALYVAITTFHPEFIPTSLTITLSTARQGIPLPAVIEALLMVSFLEILQEAGLRLPKTIGPAVSIVGGLIIGDSAARAGIVSLSMIVVIGLTAVATFTLAHYRIGLPLRVLRIPLLFAAASFGLWGLLMGIIVIMIHLCTLESFGEPYLAPLVPRTISRLYDLRDSLMVEYQPAMQNRPAYLEDVNVQRQDPEQ